MTPRCLSIGVVFVCVVCFGRGTLAQQDQFEKARARIDDLRFEVYATSRQVEELANDDAARARAWGAIQQMGITKVYLEVYRGGHVVPGSQLTLVRDWLRGKDIDVVGGIATVPGGDFGVRQQGPLGWFNWQNPKTQQDLKEVMRATAGIFDTFIVDDFLCTGDVSQESKAAKGDRSWGQYRRALLTDVARSVFVGPAKEVNPSITMIVKFPQWYDRFHLFGYDTKTLPQIFDQVWVGTETRGRTTQRFGFVQPYEGFVNYRWLADIAQQKIGGAWFDHGDCGEHDFVDQAYMSVLAGARELVFFNLGDVMAGHPDHPRVVSQFDQLADLAVAIRTHPVVGIPAYKPPNSDPAGDMYLIDFLGMLGIPVVPVHKFPEDASTILLPAHAAADPYLLTRVREAHDRGARLILTASLLSIVPEANQLAPLLGLAQGMPSQPFSAQVMSVSPTGALRQATGVTVDLESPLEIEAGSADILCSSGGKQYGLLVTSKVPASRMVVLNTHTFSQADFDAVGEVLLCPRPVGLLAMTGQPLQALRAAFHDPNAAVMEGPSCVTLHALQGDGVASYFIQNFNQRPVEVTLTIPLCTGQSGSFRDTFTRQAVSGQVSPLGANAKLDVAIAGRSRVWIQPAPAGE